MKKKNIKHVNKNPTSTFNACISFSISAQLAFTNCNSVHLLTALPIASSFASRLALAKAQMLKRPCLSLCAWSKIPNQTKFYMTVVDNIENIAIVSLFRSTPDKAENIPPKNEKKTCKQRLPIIAAKKV